MVGYSDSAHYTPRVGQRLVARVFGAADNWGELLDPSSIDARLAQIRAARQPYRASHVREVTEIVALAHETARAKHCPQTP